MMLSSSSSSSANVRVLKATSDLLNGPDWTMNIDICDSINSNHWTAKDVIKAVKKRLQHKNPRVQLLALTLLETMVKNCGDSVHLQIAERNILQEMIKIVKKRADMHVRDKILVLLDSWQEAFGGPGGKYPQYYWAYEELRRSGEVFPQRSSDTPPIFTPPVTHPTLGAAQAGYGMPSNSSTRLDEAMAADMENLSLSSIDSMRNVLDLLIDMLQAVNPSDREAVKDEVIVDLVERCRANQKKLMQMLTLTRDEELLAQGLELNDSLQSVLAKHDAIASGSPMPTQGTNINPQLTQVRDSSLKATEGRESSPINSNPSAPVVALTRGMLEEEEEEEEDDFAQLARRHSKTQSITSQSSSTGTSEGTSVNTSFSTTSSTPAASVPIPSNALALPDPPAPVRTTKEQDMIDLLSITLSTTTTSPNTPHTPAGSTQNVHQASPTAPGYPYASPTYHGSQGQIPQPQPQLQPPTYRGSQGQIPLNSYVVPWAQAQPQAQPQTQPQLQPQHQRQPQLQHQPQYPQQQQQLQHQPQFPQQQQQLQHQPQYPQYSSAYPPPPWAPTPGYFNSQNHLSSNSHAFLTPQANTTSYTPMQGGRPLQHLNSFPARGSGNMSAMNGEVQVSSSPRTTAPTAGQKPFIPSYRLFEDLNVLGNSDGRFKMTSKASPPISGTSSQSMVGGGK
ncbi:TOM1-like protein 6 [Cornus florida]|uniref:TOM1-like protein 6 n=1 Tax=Cornus florida TaxID=4283 RepID=UPI00289CBC63|nr:TOM1-like protein 6 [Cornus florida]